MKLPSTPELFFWWGFASWLLLTLFQVIYRKYDYEKGFYDGHKETVDAYQKIFDEHSFVTKHNGKSVVVLDLPDKHKDNVLDITSRINKKPMGE